MHRTRNPLGPASRDRRDHRPVPRPTLPFNSTPLDADLEILIAKLNGAKRETCRWARIAGLLKNRARLQSPTKHLVIPSPPTVPAPGFAQNLKVHRHVRARNEKDAQDDMARCCRTSRRRPRYLQPEQPDVHDQQRRRSGFRGRGEEASATVSEGRSDANTTATPVSRRDSAGLATPGVVVAGRLEGYGWPASDRLSPRDVATIKKMTASEAAVNVNTSLARRVPIKDPQKARARRAQQGVRDFTVKRSPILATSGDSQTNSFHNSARP